IFELFTRGQHYKLDTPLLDWCNSPMVALFFAFKKSDERPDDTGNRVVYALNRKLIEKIHPPTEAVYEDRIRFIESLGNRNPRLVAQTGLFTFLPNSLSIEEWVVKHFN